MKIIAIMIGCISLLLSTSLFASCGGDGGCQSSSSSWGGFLSCENGPGWSCECADPACRQDNPCLSPGRCCAAFGNIGGIEGFPND